MSSSYFSARIPQNLHANTYDFNVDDLLSDRIQTNRWYQIENDTSAQQFQSIFDEIGWNMCGISTRGDGACGLHALFGRPYHRGDMFKEGARNLVSRVFEQSPADVLAKGANLEHVETISLGLWHEFMLPHLQGVPSPEGRLFFKLAQELQPELVHQCQQHMLAATQNERKHDEIKAAIRVVSKSFFSHRWKN